MLTVLVINVHVSGGKLSWLRSRQRQWEEEGTARLA